MLNVGNDPTKTQFGGSQITLVDKCYVSKHTNKELDPGVLRGIDVTRSFIL